MTLLARLRSFLAALIGPRRLDREMDEEWRFHLDERVEALVAGGLSREDAARQAHREFGDPVRWKEEAREAHGLRLLQELVADLRYAARSLRHAPAFTLTAIMMLTLGVGLTTGVFSIVNGVFLRPWPLPDAHRIVLVLWEESRPGHWNRARVSPADFRFLREQVAAVDLVASDWGFHTIQVRHGAVDEWFPTRVVSGNYFETLRIPMALGRGLRADDDDIAAPVAVAVIGHGLWRDLFGGAADAIGRTIRLFDVPFRIVGVAAPGATDSPWARAPAVWVPLAAYQLFTPDLESGREYLTDPDRCCVELAGRLRGGQSRAAAAAELQLAVSRLSKSDDSWRAQLTGVRLTGTAIADQPWDPQRGTALALVVVWLLVVLLVACANLGNLQLARAMSRRRELAVRAVLGAGRARIVRQLLTEGLLIAAVASATALAAAYVIAGTIVWLAPPSPWLPRVDNLASLVSPDLRVAGFGCLLATAAMLAAGIGPALAGTRRLIGPGPASGVRHLRMRAAFLAVQVALSVVLLVGAALLARGVARATTLIPDAVQDVVRVRVLVPAAESGDRTSNADGVVFRVDADTRGYQWVFEDLRARLGSGPHRLSVSPRAAAMTVRADADDAGWRVSVRTVSPEFFPMLGIPLLAGDLFGAPSHPADVVVNESLARLLRPRAPVLGRVLLHAGEPVRIVGVVSDAHWIDAAEPGPTLFVRGYGPLLVRNEPAVLDAVRAAAADLDPAARVVRDPVGPRPEVILTHRLAAGVSGALGLLALGMATAGTFGVFMYLFTQRSREIAVRMALGARVVHLARLVTGEGLGALAWGAAAGLVGSALAAPVLRTYLLGLSPYDPLAYLAAVTVLAMAILVASAVPVRRAVSIDPARTLHQE